MGLAPTGVWRVPPSPIAIGGPFPQAKPLPSPPSPSLFPPPPLALFARLREGAAQAGGGGGVLGRKGVEGGGASKRHLGPDPHRGVLDSYSKLNVPLTKRPFFLVHISVFLCLCFSYLLALLFQSFLLILVLLHLVVAVVLLRLLLVWVSV